MPKFSSQRSVAFGAAGCLVLVGAAGAFASTSTSDPGYRTTTVRVGDVQQLLNLTGTIAVVSKASAGFPVAGRVATVTAHVGDLVTAGQVLATLATAPLTDAVTQAAAAVAQAHATLQTDQGAVTLPAVAAVVSATAGMVTVGAGSGRSSHLASGAHLSPQSAVTQALAEAAKAMQDALQIVAAAQVACAPRPANSSTPDATPSSAPGSTPSASPDASPNSTPGPRQGGGQSATPSTRRSTPPRPTTGPADCLGAQTDSLAALQVLATQQQGVAAAQQKLSAALAAVPTSGTGTTNPSATNSPANVVARSSSAGSRSTVGGQGAQSPAARVTLDQAAILAAQAALDAANRNLAGSTLTSPIGGRVSAQPFTAGSLQAVGTRVNVIGPGAVEVTVDVPETSLRLVKVGQTASVIANGATASVSGAVMAIGMLPSSSTTSSSSYPVTVLVPHPTQAFLSGAAAAVTVIVTSVHAVLTVPNSALSMAVLGGRQTVNVLTTGKPVRTPVQVGAAGALVTEVTSGIHAGQILVLADPSQVLPASSATLPTIRQIGPNPGGGGGGRGGGGAGRAARG